MKTETVLNSETDVKSIESKFNELSQTEIRGNRDLIRIVGVILTLPGRVVNNPVSSGSSTTILVHSETLLGFS